MSDEQNMKELIVKLATLKDLNRIIGRVCVCVLCKQEYTTDHCKSCEWASL